ncbi:MULTISPECIES: DUF6172 family protein [Pseudoalteromonas]|uniref:Uncharacterized protein n=1 Tax=Pseudoalteromonas amylolytica TaxID=1859457 RepID=A0A1S1MWW1_9GAMM|nr:MULTISPECIES: DUF6172 family protein [Pseudoalteromonas]OHU88117.1 hypothetical protein BFC16_12055 [Pseudoalteromonas sp. JW3]OHU91557.1 hypothetical protein BET10_12175 [Pseudoalteromonas amylolytica]
MRKTFALTHPKLKPARLVDAIKYEVKKYLRRERNKNLPADADFWDFDCRFGATESQADVIKVTQINKHIDHAVDAQLPSFYLEILAKPGYRAPLQDEE